MTGAMILMFLGALLYGVVALMFLAFSCAELIDTGRSSRGRLLLAISAAAAWPVALVVASVAAAMARRPAARPASVDRKSPAAAAAAGPRKAESAAVPRKRLAA
ncbi:hypothetical protein GWI72_09955 [Microvirga tunisiensis]|uniref:Uncharacterized protein n=2 Tax=Pannonibacter tanglangensis TaxID=2750084 RepID=A0ABW9ZDV7_9HYPH|nr:MULTISPECIES: hypothetical protein [unclassified Pannonibacter]NBN63019.1 hypothetical protein [Pannonibacter sp. XCT-34]NBN78591.1 hypothetical protein [Pannonibacter sp. XCT-53]